MHNDLPVTRGLYVPVQRDTQRAPMMKVVCTLHRAFAWLYSLARNLLIVCAKREFPYAPAVEALRELRRCDVCRAHNAKKKCAVCLVARYCGGGCQRLDWRQHKTLCASAACLARRSCPRRE